MKKRILLRLLFLALVFLTALNPYLSVKKGKSDVSRAMLVDVSRSMRGPRWERTKKILKQFEDAPVDRYVFSGRLEKMEGRAVESKSPEGDLSDIPLALGEMSGYSEVFIVSDGASNGPTEEGTVSARIHSIYVGDKPAPDGSIEEVEAPFYAFAGTPVEVRTKLKFRNFLPAATALSSHRISCPLACHITPNRVASAPYSFMYFNGSMPVPSDFDIRFPSLVKTVP